MNSKKYAEKYAGRLVKVKTDGAHRGAVGLVSGYYGPHNWILLEVIESPRIDSYEQIRTNNKIYWGQFVFTRQLPLTIKWCTASIDGLELMPEIIISNAPDNCDDCGAVGEEVCKKDCPNKNQ